MKRTLLCIFLAVAALGCNKEATNAETGGAGAGQTGTETGQAPSNVNNPAVMSEPPSSAAPGQSIRIQPSNPNDPKFQADPKLAGGG